MNDIAFQNSNQRIHDHINQIKQFEQRILLQKIYFTNLENPDTYQNQNFKNVRLKILQQVNGVITQNIKLVTYQTLLSLTQAFLTKKYQDQRFQMAILLKIFTILSNNFTFKQNILKNLRNFMSLEITKYTNNRLMKSRNFFQLYQILQEFNQLNIITEQITIYLHYVMTPLVKNQYLAQKKDQLEELKIPTIKTNYQKIEINFDKYEIPKYFLITIELLMDIDLPNFSQLIKLRTNLDKLKTPVQLTKIYRQLANINSLIRRSTKQYFYKYNKYSIQQQQTSFDQFSINNNQFSLQQLKDIRLTDSIKKNQQFNKFLKIKERQMTTNSTKENEFFSNHQQFFFQKKQYNMKQNQLLNKNNKLSQIYSQNKRVTENQQNQNSPENQRNQVQQIFLQNSFTKNPKKQIQKLNQSASKQLNMYQTQNIITTDFLKKNINDIDYLKKQKKKKTENINFNMIKEFVLPNEQKQADGAITDQKINKFIYKLNIGSPEFIRQSIIKIIQKRVHKT